MKAAQQSSNRKRERVIPVKVTYDPRPAPTNLPPQPEPVAPPPKKPAPPSITEQVKHSPPVRVMRQPVHEWSEAKRRRLMWWLVAGGTVVVIIGWLTVVQSELNSHASGQNLFHQAGQLLKSIRWPAASKPSAAEQEQQQLNQQVFPQFNK